MISHPLLKYLARRFLILVTSFASALVVIYVLLRIIPGDPSDSLVPIGATPTQILAAKHAVGTDKPLIAQFGHWISQIVRLRFGNSYISGSPVAPEIFARLRITLPLTLIAFALAILIAIPVGIAAARKGERGGMDEF